MLFSWWPSSFNCFGGSVLYSQVINGHETYQTHSKPGDAVVWPGIRRCGGKRRYRHLNVQVVQRRDLRSCWPKRCNRSQRRNGRYWGHGSDRIWRNHWRDRSYGNRHGIVRLLSVGERGFKWMSVRVRQHDLGDAASRRSGW